ncbi:MAG: ATP-binding protein, partial [Myxococcota bacterium]
AVRKRFEGPVVILSSIQDEETRLAARRAGATEFVQKWTLDGAALARTLLYAIERHRRERLLTQVVHVHVEPTFLVDSLSRVIAANAAGEELVEGSESSGAVGAPCPFDTDSRVPQYRTIEGKERVFEVRCSPLIVEDDELSLVAVRDITERARAAELEARLLHSDRLATLGQMAAGVAHEVNNPAAFILSNQSDLLERINGLMKRRTAPPMADLRALLSDWRELLRDNQLGIERIVRISSQLRRFSRADDAPVERMLIADIAEEAHRVVAHRMRHHARFELQSNQSDPITVDTGRMVQLFTNLMVNAIDAMPRGRSNANCVRVSIDQGTEGLSLRISDTGTGIPKEKVAKIFDPFFTTKGLHDGTGLGLALCADIVAFHGGTIECHSTVGLGTEFSIELPFKNGLHAAVPVANPRRIASFDRTLRMLVVDDDPSLMRAMQRRLEKRYQVRSALSGLEALELLADDHEFDVILCDVLMPNMDGPTFCKEVAARHPALAERFVFMSGGGSDQKQAAGLSGFVCVPKPFNWQELDAHVADVVIRQNGPQATVPEPV